MLSTIFCQQASLLFLLLWLLVVVVVLASDGCFGFTTSQRTLPKPRVGGGVALLDDPTPQDELLEQWYIDNNIRGVDRVKVRTSQRSVAGRGLFFSFHDDDKCAERGDVLALIPSQCVLCTDNAQHIRPDLSSSLDKLERNKWPLALTACAQVALQDASRSWSPWIETWTGPQAPQPPESVSAKELQSLAIQADSSPREIQQALEVRYDVFQQHCKRFGDMMSNNKSLKHDLYGIVLSRAANLGPHWNHQSGIIPLHDMLNHPPAGTLPSVELFTIGELCRQTSQDHVEQLLFSSGHLCPTTRQDETLQEKDLVLVARRAIQPGEELFLSYTKRELLATNEKDRVWKMLQYGFCLE